MGMVLVIIVALWILLKRKTEVEPSSKPYTPTIIDKIIVLNVLDYTNSASCWQYQMNLITLKHQPVVDYHLKKFTPRLRILACPTS